MAWRAACHLPSIPAFNSAYALSFPATHNTPPGTGWALSLWGSRELSQITKLAGAEGFQKTPEQQFRKFHIRTGSFTFSTVFS